jgi:hypothetical protein
MVTSVIGRMDCLTVRALAPVRPLLLTDLRCCCCMASTLDGRRWLWTSAGVGSSLLKRPMMSGSGSNDSAPKALFLTMMVLVGVSLAQNKEQSRDGPEEVVELLSDETFSFSLGCE